MAFSRHGTLVADTVTTITLGDSNTNVEVLNRSSEGTIYATANGTAPTVAGENTFVIPAGHALIIPDSEVSSNTVKLISSTADAYSVTAVA